MKKGDHGVTWHIITREICATPPKSPSEEGDKKVGLMTYIKDKREGFPLPQSHRFARSRRLRETAKADKTGAGAPKHPLTVLRTAEEQYGVLIKNRKSTKTENAHAINPRARRKKEMIFREGVQHEGLERELVEKLAVAEALMHPAKGDYLEITSGYREGDKGSHGQGKAVDISAHSARQRFKIVRALIRAGFNRIGVYDRHVHADIAADDTHPHSVLWTGESQ